MDKKDDKGNKNLNIELNDEIAEGVYANLAMIAHSSSEFVIDFIRLMPGVPKAKVKSRVVITPEHAKRLLQALDDNIKKYENPMKVLITRASPSTSSVTARAKPSQPNSSC